ncbi:Myb/SANT-like domain [Dillenia turbinata]|uniref:Myb/SANT-like domain n=1 Tax=Dillenia turbinata TaxID=194707 RepID=A0AAN8ZIA2_9MAGN
MCYNANTEKAMLYSINAEEQPYCPRGHQSEQTFYNECLKECHMQHYADKFHQRAENMEGQHKALMEDNQQRVEENTKARCAKWDDYAPIKFVELCEEEIRKGKRPKSYLSKDRWRNLITGKNYDKKQMKNNWSTMKSEWKLFKSLTHGETGVRL